jgi:hypothetical protein
MFNKHNENQQLQFGMCHRMERNDPKIINLCTINLNKYLEIVYKIYCIDIIR